MRELTECELAEGGSDVRAVKRSLQRADVEFLVAPHYTEISWNCLRPVVLLGAIGLTTPVVAVVQEVAVPVNRRRRGQPVLAFA